MLPVLAQITASQPASLALLMAMVMPRSLKDPVGLRPSYLTKTFTSLPIRSSMAGTGISGVAPSLRVITGVVEVTGSQAL